MRVSFFFQGDVVAGGGGHYYDGRLLALYFVATLVFEDPLSRRQVSRGEVEKLDAYLRQHRLGKAQVAKAWALEMDRKATAAGERRRVGWGCGWEFVSLDVCLFR
jgi:hypothetical protein